MRLTRIVSLSMFLLACSDASEAPSEDDDVEHTAVDSDGDLELHIALAAVPRSLDPTLAADSYSIKVVSQIYEGLLSYHPYARPYQLIPALASEMPTVSQDKLTYSFTLREDVFFADDPCFPNGKGRKVTAQDFVYAFKRFAHPETQATGWWLLDGKIEGLNEWRSKLEQDIADMRGKGQEVEPLYGIDRPLSGIQAMGEQGLLIRLGAAGEANLGSRVCHNNRDDDRDGLVDMSDPDCVNKPYPALLWVLAMPYAAVYPHEAVEYYGRDFARHPVGTGPFKMKSYERDTRIVLEENPNFREAHVPDPVGNPDDRLPGWDWLEDVDAGLLVHAGERIPLVAGIELSLILEDSLRWEEFERGRVDFLNPPRDYLKEAVVQGEISPELAVRGVRLSTWTELGTVYTVFNLRDSVTANVHLRRAIALTIDHRWVIDNLYAGQAVMATSVIPPGVAGYDPDVHPYHRTDGRADIQAAKAELALAGYPGGIDPDTNKPLRLLFQSSGSTATDMQFASRFSDDMGRIGIELDVVSNSWPQFLEKLDKGDFQVGGLAWGFDYPDAQNILQTFYSENIHMSLNNAFYESDEFDALYERAIRLDDSPERTALYEQMAAMVGEDVPWVTRVHRVRQNLQQPWLTGFKYTEVNEQYWHYAGIDGARRKQATRMR